MVKFGMLAISRCSRPIERDRSGRCCSHTFGDAQLVRRLNVRNGSDCSKLLFEPTQTVQTATAVRETVQTAVKTT